LTSYRHPSKPTDKRIVKNKKGEKMEFKLAAPLEFLKEIPFNKQELIMK
jgi:hypothetical protein